jgi:hypothetical protein
MSLKAGNIIGQEFLFLIILNKYSLLDDSAATCKGSSDLVETPLPTPPSP